MYMYALNSCTIQIKVKMRAGVLMEEVHCVGGKVHQRSGEGTRSKTSWGVQPDLSYQYAKVMVILF